ncbi:MAG: hypothetical protein LBG19_05620 [Prevotellaceae bacterium]|jgi:hypothetical protein|nr:hypothetical protein [Prevotellaceae bacterium]
MLDGYRASLPACEENFCTAVIRSNRVKSEFIINKGLKESDFVTNNHTTAYEGHKDMITLRIPAKVEAPDAARLEWELREREAAEREQAAHERAERERAQREQAERERVEAERAAREQSERETLPEQSVTESAILSKPCGLTCFTMLSSPRCSA